MTAKDVLIAVYDKGYRVTKNGEVIGLKGKKLKTRLTNRGYPYFNARVNGKKRVITVHRLAAYQKFGDDLFEEGVVVRHLDNNKQNNSLENISLGNWHDNFNDMTEEIKNKMFASQIRTRKFKDSDIKEIRKELENGTSIRELAERFEVHQGTIQQIKERRTYKWVE